MKLSQNSCKRQMPANSEGLPSLKRDLQNAKLFLQQRTASGESLYDHLSNVIAKVVDERPKDVLEYFELFSQRVREETFRTNEGNMLENNYKKPEHLVTALKLLPTIIEKSEQPIKATVGNDDETLKKSTKGDEGDVIYCKKLSEDLCELQFYWNLLGIGFPREEVLKLSCSVEKLKAHAAIASCRFWGKMLGLKKDYYVVETTLTKSAFSDWIVSCIPQHMEEKECLPTESLASESNPIPLTTSASMMMKKADDKDSVSDLRDKMKRMPTEWKFSLKNFPVSQYRPHTANYVTEKEIEYGVDRHVYFVCTDLGDDWIPLPQETSHHINISRQIKKYLTGYLDSYLILDSESYILERNYLRALIARISAGTHISPRNFYKFQSDDNENFFDDLDDDDDDDDNDASSNNEKPIKVNSAYRPWSIKKLLQLDYWQHHKVQITEYSNSGFFLKKGKVTDENDRKLDEENNVSRDTDDKGDDNDDDDGREIANNGIKPETPIPLFASCSGDQLTNDAMSPWTIRLSDVVETLVSVQSHVWPGAFAFVKDRICDNIYIGYGLKSSSTNATPPAIPNETLDNREDS
ncbi:CLUMA_CG015204, isoform A [Clunio marinus]|uniref:CLUMA_CG015204, isoform A n=1 Tax=Clunio marinus TaxID=568069 RepID=A0A1J1IQ69_9DIPT|nr:CLUMA_CG015204, isoform A [Clunio marinus]